MKRVLSAFLILILFSFMLLSASADGVPTITVSNAEGEPGDEVRLTVSLSNNPGIVGMTIGFTYDADALTLESMLKDSMDGSWYMNSKAVWASSGGDQTYNGVILTLKFKISDTAKGGVYPIGIDCSGGDICNSALEVVNFAHENGSITVKSDTSVQASQPTSVPTSAPTSVPTTATTPEPTTIPTPQLTPKVADAALGTGVSGGIVSDTVESAISEDSGDKDVDPTSAVPAEVEKPGHAEEKTDGTKTEAKADDAAETGKAPEVSKSDTGAPVYIVISAVVICAVAAAVIILKKRHK